MKAIELKTEHMKNPLGLESRRPLLSWRCENGQIQKAYQIEAKIKGNVVWDSGRIESNDMSVRFPWQLEQRTAISWRVQLWDDSGLPGGWSEPGYFETGITAEAWRARWITPEESCDPEVRKPAGYLRKQFEMPSFDEVRLYGTAHGLYNVFINGKRLGEAVFTPGCDEYDKRLSYQTYDVTEYLHEGENEIQVVLGDGWYRGCNGIDGVRNLFGEDLSFLCQLEADGRPVLCSDSSWEASQRGPILMTDLELGEIYDAGMEEILLWYPAREMSFGYDNLVGTEAVPILELESFEGRLFTAPNGDKVFDFGQNIAGYTQIIADGTGGEKISLIHGEALDENGNFTIENFQPGERNKSGGIKQEIHYTCKPGHNDYKPSFSLFGFRYAKLTGDFPAEKLRLVAHAVYSDMGVTSSFESSSAELNQLFKNSLWSMKGNFCDIPTDCPTRERAGWTGDAAVFALAGVRMMGSATVFRKWLANVRACQHEDGRMAYIAPHNGPGGQISEMFSASVGWGDASVIVPFALYNFTGDKAILKENFLMMKRWVDFLVERAKQKRPEEEENPYSDYIINVGMDYGEWNEPGASVMETMQKAFQYGQPEVATAYYSHSAKLLSRISGILGKKEEQIYYSEISERAREAYRFLWNRDIYKKTKRQCEYVRPLAFELLDSEDKEKAASELNRLVKENGYHLNTGFLSTPYLCQVLADNGYADTAYELLLQKEYPSWLYAVEKGATTIWETWDGVRKDGTIHDSLNHYSYGAVSGWLIGGVCGIKYSFDRLILEPIVNPKLGFAKAELDSPRGRILSSWKYDGERNSFAYEFEIPAGVNAEIRIPGREPLNVTGGSYKL